MNGKSNRDRAATTWEGQKNFKPLGDITNTMHVGLEIGPWFSDATISDHPQQLKHTVEKLP